MKVIGLTGGIATGKSSVSQILERMGAQVISSDAIAHSLIERNGKCYFQVIHQFGKDILKPDGQINRKTLGEIIFNTPAARTELEKIIHPAVIAEIKTKIKEFRETESKWLVVEVPLLFEVGLVDIFDQIWVVSTTPSQQLQRLQSRDHLSVTEAQVRIDAQYPLAEKEARADVVIHNQTDLTELEKHVRQALL